MILNRQFYKSPVSSECSTLLAHQWRDSSWGKRVEGVTVTHPSEFLSTGCPITASCISDGGYLQVICDLTDVTDAFNKIGHFKPFFGGKTKEKIKYDGGKIVMEAPAFLKKCLENLRYITWGTGVESNLANLLRLIVTSMTDIDPDLLTPVEGQVTGTDAHRWADQRTSHKSTISLSYLLSTHFTVNTNKFNPQSIPRLENYENVNVSFQAVFSWMAWINNLNLNNRELPKKNQHWHISCQNCIQGIDESLADIPAEALTEAGDCLSNMPRGDFTFIPSSRFFKSPPTLSKFPIKSITNVVDAAELLPTFVTESLLQHAYRSCGSSVIPLDHTTTPMPVAIALKVDPGSVLKEVSHWLLLSVIFLNCIGFSAIENLSWKLIMSKSKSLISYIANSWFLYLTPLFLFRRKFQMFTEDFRFATPPKGVPPSQEEYACCLRHIVMTLIGAMEVEDLAKFLSIKMIKGTPYTTNKLFHPTVLALLEKAASTPAVLSKCMRALTAIRALTIEAKKFSLPSDVHLAPLIEGDPNLSLYLKGIESNCKTPIIKCTR